MEGRWGVMTAGEARRRPPIKQSIIRANHVDLHDARPLTLFLPHPPEDTVDLASGVSEGWSEASLGRWAWA